MGCVKDHALLAAIGTDGDVYRFLALGLELRKRGYRVTLATHEHFAPHAHAGGLDFKPIVSATETERLLDQRDFWHPLKSALIVARWGARLIPRQYEILKELSAPEGTFLVAGPGVIAARVVQEHAKVPLVSLILQPWIIPSLHAPPVIMGGLTLPHWMPRPIGGLYFQLIHQIGARLMGAEFRRLRASLGLKPIRRMFRWWFSPELVIGLFPEWFGPPQPDWPPQICLAGFPLSDGQTGIGLPEKLLRFCNQGTPVIAFTFGTGMRHATALFQQAIQACRLLQKRAVLLTSFPSQLPADLPDFVLHCEFAPFQELFPLCAAVVHHGGIGTVAKALAAGTPQLIIPFAFDQQDNALRVKKLGAGTWLKPNQRQVNTMASALASLTTAESISSARALVSRFNARSGIKSAADHIQSFSLQDERH